jgi:hypothetical protein
LTTAGAGLFVGAGNRVRQENGSGRKTGQAGKRVRQENGSGRKTGQAGKRVRTILANRSDPNGIKLSRNSASEHELGN